MPSPSGCKHGRPRIGKHSPTPSRRVGGGQPPRNSLPVRRALIGAPIQRPIGSSRSYGRDLGTSAPGPGRHGPRTRASTRDSTPGSAKPTPKVASCRPSARSGSSRCRAKPRPGRRSSWRPISGGRDAQRQERGCLVQGPGSGRAAGCSEGPLQRSNAAADALSRAPGARPRPPRLWKGLGDPPRTRTLWTSGQACGAPAA
jgi:hypothetical protein